MPIAYVQEFDAGDDRSTTNYDSVKERLNVEADPPEGMIVHTAGFTAEGVFRIFDVWESEEHFGRFRDERLMPIVQEILSSSPDAAPAREYTYKLHDVVRG
jgi:hypothetical protein